MISRTRRCPRQGFRERLLPVERFIQALVVTERPLCPFRRVRPLTSEEDVRPVVQGGLEAAFSRADHLYPVGFFKSLLQTGGGR